MASRTEYSSNPMRVSRRAPPAPSGESEAAAPPAKA
jgi:hypothetical protein